MFLEICRDNIFPKVCDTDYKFIVFFKWFQEDPFTKIHDFLII